MGSVRSTRSQLCSTGVSVAAWDNLGTSDSMASRSATACESDALLQLDADVSAGKYAAGLSLCGGRAYARGTLHRNTHDSFTRPDGRGSEGQKGDKPSSHRKRVPPIRPSPCRGFALEASKCA